MPSSKHESFHWHQLELFSNSTSLLVGSWYLSHTRQFFHIHYAIWCMLRGSVEVWTKNILYWFMKNHFGMPRGASEYRVLSIYIQTLPPSIRHKWKEIIDIVCKTTKGKVMANQLQIKTPTELKGSLYWQTQKANSMRWGLKKRTRGTKFN